MIQLKDINKTFYSGKESIVALTDIDLTINKGEIFGIIGLSGAGKSTLLRTINLLERPDSGKIFVNHQDLTQLSEKQLCEYRKKIGIIFQHFNLLSSYNVFDNVAELLRIHRYPKTKIKPRVNELLNLVGLEDKATVYPANLSGGQKQRVGIARALAINSEILLCDEATSALDPQTTDSILNLLLDINKKLNLTIVLITHEMDVIKKVCDRVAVMEKGEIVETGTVIDVFSHPKNPTTKSFVKTIFNDALPPKLLKKVMSHTENSMLLKIVFRGENVLSPMLDDLHKRFNITTTILYGTITDIKENSLGIFIIKISGEENSIIHSIEYIKKTVFYTEMLDIKDSKTKELITN